MTAAEDTCGSKSGVMLQRQLPLVCTQAGTVGWEGTGPGRGLQAPATEPAWAHVELGVWGYPDPVTEP